MCCTKRSYSRHKYQYRPSGDQLYSGFTSLLPRYHSTSLAFLHFWSFFTQYLNLVLRWACVVWMVFDIFHCTSYFLWHDFALKHYHQCNLFSSFVTYGCCWVGSISELIEIALGSSVDEVALLSHFFNLKSSPMLFSSLRLLMNLGKWFFRIVFVWKMI